MNVALIFAGGTGQRMNSKSRPKQFLEMHGKPIIIHTLEYFEEHPEIDAICIVCLTGWEQKLKKLLANYGICKVKWITSGGETGHDSIYQGLEAMKDELKEKDVIIIHDGVRPLISKELISENIRAVMKYGNAITVEKVSESVVEMDCNDKIVAVPQREQMRTAKAPQCFYFEEIWEVHKQAQMDGFKSIDSAHLMHYYGHELHTVESTPYNIKIASPADFYVFRALLEARENSQIFGI